MRNRFQLLLDLFIALILLVLLRFGLRLAFDSDEWCVGDWLINYHGGFVRRGLAGEVILAVARSSHVRPPWIVLFIQLLCYCILLLTFRKLVLDSSKRIWILMLTVSPATLAFPLLEIYGGYRKELLFFASLAILLFLLLYRKTSDGWLIAYLCLVLPAAILSSEVVAFYLPYYLAALILARENWRRGLLIFAVPAILACTATLFSASYLGNLHVAQTICSAAGYEWSATGPCSGSIAYLATTKEAAHKELSTDLQTSPVFELYPVLALLSFMPILFGVFHLSRFPALRRSIWVFGYALGSSAAFSTVLFYYTSDWGRWIYMHTLAAAFLILVIERRKQTDITIAEPEGTPIYGPRRIVVSTLVGIYALCWNLPPDAGGPYLPIRVFVLSMAQESTIYWAIGRLIGLTVLATTRTCFQARPDPQPTEETGNL
jgi:hypothetical protein